MRHRTQLYLDHEQHRWLRQRAGERGSIAAVVRGLIDNARSGAPISTDDPLIRYLAEEAPSEGRAPSSVETLDRDLYG